MRAGNVVGRVMAGLCALMLGGCVASDASETGAATPVMRWDHRPEALRWTTASMSAIADQDMTLALSVPADIEGWCPGYENASLPDRRAFWAGLLSALAKHESTWNPAASGGGGRWIGLTQISPGTARAYGCEATTSAALKDGEANLACAVRIAAKQVGRDRMVAGSGRAGLGRDWAPFSTRSKRADMAAWTSGQSYCKAHAARGPFAGRGARSAL